MDSKAHIIVPIILIHGLLSLWPPTPQVLFGDDVPSLAQSSTGSGRAGCGCSLLGGTTSSIVANGVEPSGVEKSRYVEGWESVPCKHQGFALLLKIIALLMTHPHFSRICPCACRQSSQLHGRSRIPTIDEILYWLSSLCSMTI